MRTRGMTLAELAIAAGLSIVLLALVGTGAVWMRNSMRLVTSLEQDSQVLWLSRILNRELNAAREILYPPAPTQGEVSSAHQLAFVDQFGDVTVLFVDTQGRLIQFSRDRDQFRDLFLGVGDLKVHRYNEDSFGYEVLRQDTAEPEIIRGTFQLAGLDRL